MNSTSTALTMLRMASVASCAHLPSVPAFPVDDAMLAAASSPSDCCDLKSSKDWVRFAKNVAGSHRFCFGGFRSRYTEACD